ncbi:MAG: LytTR family DNA-binding domain-containing protein [Verrucomicrobia bacterium]|nr:LytTR family DNA-binding domain-containing protein [Verrucomicrobiota bacterium]
MTIHAFIIDDEPLARERLRKLLLTEPDLKIAGEYGNGCEAVEAIQTLKPDLIFLDVQMPELDGFGVLQALSGERLPVVIFVTAYDKFALQAFEVHAVDYLLKPFDRERFQKALSHARARLQSHQAGELNQRLSALLNDLKPRAPIPDRLVIKCDGRVLFVKTEDIDWIEAADNYVNLHVGCESHLFRETMGALEGRLSPERFLRISRSAIVNVERIKELQPMFHGEYTVILRTGARLTLSRGYREKLQRLMGK